MNLDKVENQALEFAQGMAEQMQQTDESVELTKQEFTAALLLATHHLYKQAVEDDDIIEYTHALNKRAVEVMFAVMQEKEGQPPQAEADPNEGDK